jgi:hypothetical protein
MVEDFAPQWLRTQLGCVNAAARLRNARPPAALWAWRFPQHCGGVSGEHRPEDDGADCLTGAVGPTHGAPSLRRRSRVWAEPNSPPKFPQHRGLRNRPGDRDIIVFNRRKVRSYDMGPHGRSSPQ